MTPDLDFPANLPCFLREGYSLNHVQPFARTEMATGRARQRRTFQSVPSEITASLLLTDLEAQLFEAWFAYDAVDGTKWFNARVKTPQGLKPYACRFMDMYSGPQLTGNNQWRVECRLEIFERPLTPPEWYEFGREFILHADIIDKAINREWPEA